MRQHALRQAGEGGQQQATQGLAQARGRAEGSRAIPAAEQQQQQLGQGPKLAAAAITLGAVGAATFTALSSQPQLPPVGEVLGPLAAIALGGPALGLLAAKVVLGDLFHVELHRFERGDGPAIGSFACCCCSGCKCAEGLRHCKVGMLQSSQPGHELCYALLQACTSAAP